MCSYKTWYHDEQTGYVVQCTECNKIQVGFGVLSLTLKMPDFETFRRQIAECFDSTIPDIAGVHIKSIWLPTPVEGMNLLLTYKELDNLFQMLEFSDNEMRAEGLLQCFKQPGK